MELTLSPEQQDLASVADTLLDARAPLTLAREFLEGGGDASPLWDAIAEAGWTAVGLEEDDPFGVTGLCLLAERCGTHVAPALLVDTAVAARLAAAVPSDARDDLVESIATGEATVALAALEPTSDWSLAHLTCRIHAGASGVTVLSGTKLGVHHAERADAFAVIARADADGAPAVAFIPRTARGVSVSRDAALDPTSAACGVAFDEVKIGDGRLLGGPLAAAAIAAAFDVGAVATAAEGIGAASRALAMAVEYAGTRKQFGRPIGSFQALQHLMAERHIEREAAWATVLDAARQVDLGLAGASESASIAKALAARATRSVVEGALQVLGGIAFTWEHDVHLLQRRVLECERRFGDAIHHERRLGDLIHARARARA